jgi:hypothetical protein
VSRDLKKLWQLSGILFVNMKLEKQYYEKEGVMENMIAVIRVTDNGMSSISSSSGEVKCDEC